KFGVWPGTDRLVYRERWLERFLQALREAPGLVVSTFSRYLDTHPPAGRIYLPTAAYTEMGEWALPPSAALELEAARHRLAELPGGERLSRLLRGGFFRNFLLKYPEIGDAYWKMLRLSGRVREGLAARPRDPRVLAARERLWQGQANDAYWHGVFGGCYLPHLRRAVKSALIGCERRLEGAGKPIGIECVSADVDGDGQAEVTVRSHTLGVTLRPARGGSLTELAWMGGEVDVADVLTRPPERPRDRRGEDHPLRARGEGGRAPRAAPLRPVPPGLAAGRALSARGGPRGARPARAVGRGVGGGGRAAARPRGEDLAARGRGAVLVAAPGGPPDGAPEVSGGGRGR